MSKILRKCLSLGLAVMLLASLSLNGILTASADNKTGDGLAAYAMRAYNEGWVYSWGGASPGAADCSGLIYSYVGGGERTTEGMLNASNESGYVSNGVPDIPGIGLWQPGHVGVYVGDGMAVDMRDEISNACFQSVASKSWVMWFKVDGVSYDTNSSVTNDNQSNNDSSDIYEDSEAYELEYLSRGSNGSEVWDLQERLKELGYFDEDATGYFGYVTEAALIEFQYNAGLTPDGVYSDETEYALTAENAPEKISVYEETADSEEDILSGDSEENVNIPTEDDEEINSDSADLSSEDTEFEDNLDNSDEEENPDTTDTYENDETTASNDIIFTYGDFGDGVSNIQYILINLGYYHDDITGEYDEKTFNSVEFFQLDNDLSATGSVDEQTLDALFIEFANKNSQTDNSADITEEDEQPLETAFVENEVKTEKLFLSSGKEISNISDETTNSETVVTESAEEFESTDTSTDTEFSDSDTNSYAETAVVTVADAETDTATTAVTAADAETDRATTAVTAADTETDTTTKATSSQTSETVKSGGKNTQTGTSTDTGSTPKSPKTGDPLVMSIQSAVDFVKNYVNTTLIFIIIGISCIVIFFAGTVHYWNVSMEKRRQRARKASTVSAFRRGSM